MYLFIVSLHIFLCLMLVLVIILQPGKGGDIASAFGGGAASTIFGPQGPTNLLQRATSVVAVLFMVTSISLAWYSSRATLSNANVDDELLRLQEARKAAEAQTEAPTPAAPVEEATEAPADAPPPVAPVEPSEAAPSQDAVPTP